MFGSDFLTYCYDKDHGTRVEDTMTSSILEYWHDHWESQYGVHIRPQPPQDLSGKCHPMVTNLDLDAAILNEPAPILSPESEPAKCNLESVTSHSSPQLEAAVVIEDQGETILPQQTALQVVMAKTSTRGEDAALYSLLPPLAARSSLTLRPVYGKTSHTDPFSLTERPCESYIQKAQKFLHDAKKAGMNLTGIDIDICILK